MKTIWFALSTLLLINFAASSSQAAHYYSTEEAQCTPVDFRETFPLKMRNQHDLSWCFAHAASDYLQFAYHLPEQISAADIAINYGQSKLGKIMHFFQGLGGSNARQLPAQTGFIKVAVKQIIPQGYCPENALPSDEWNHVDATTGVQIKQDIRWSILETFELYKKVQAGDVAGPHALQSYFTFKNIDRDQFYSILRDSTKKNLMQNIRAAACKDERKPFGSNYLSSDFQIRGKHVFQNMNASFDRGMPVTIDFFSDVFRHFDRPKIDVNELHTVLVYGRKFNPESQQCQYMIKDSYGEQCTKYDPKISCEGGYVWLPENKLFRAMTSQLILYP